MSLSEDIKSLALETGFHAVGITNTLPFIEAEQALKARYQQGLLEGSGYNPENIYKYTHPQETFPCSRSIISVALSYLTDDMEESRSGSGPRGWMARFSRGLDYHHEIQRRLQILSDKIQTNLGKRIEVRSLADTGPLVDRSSAIRAGIGPHGKNTCVYAGDYSSWVILGELVTDLELETDSPATLEACGECNECIKACPTGAICAPYVVDGRICLSYITQSKGFIPHWLREKMGTRIYGCDTCQSACPLNKSAKLGNIDIFRPSAGLGKNPELLPLLNISPEGFKARVGPTTVSWIRRTRFRRNAAVALGNIGDPIAVTGLIEALSDPEPVLRGHAAWALGKIKIQYAHSALESALNRETDDQVKTELRMALDIT